MKQTKFSKIATLTVMTLVASTLMAATAQAKNKKHVMKGSSITVELERGKGENNSISTFLLSLPPDSSSVEAMADGGRQRVKVYRTSSDTKTATISLRVQSSNPKNKGIRDAKLDLTGKVTFDQRVLLGKIDLGSGDSLKVWVKVNR